MVWVQARPWAEGSRHLPHLHITHTPPPPSPFNPGDNHKVGAIIPILQIKNLTLGEMKSLTVAQLVGGKAGMQTLGQMLALISFSHSQPWGPLGPSPGPERHRLCPSTLLRSPRGHTAAPTAPGLSVPPPPRPGHCPSRPLRVTHPDLPPSSLPPDCISWT